MTFENLCDNRKKIIPNIDIDCLKEVETDQLIIDEVKKNLLKAIAILTDTKIIEAKDNIYLSICFLQDEQTHKLNLQYRNKDKKADILAFPATSACPPDIKPLGDIVFAYNDIVAKARKLQIKPEKRFTQLAVHALLHLCDFHHDTEEGYQKMHRAENLLLQSIGYDAIEYEES